MHLQNPEFLASVALQRFSAAGDGMHLEVTRERSPGAAANGEPILSFRKAETGEIQVAIHWPDRDVVMLLSELKRAIEVAEIEVQNEAFYDQ